MTLAADPLPRARPGLSRSRLARLLLGGAVDDLGRLPRYGAFLLLGLAAVWGPIAAYLLTAPLRFTSEASLILPGSGAGASVNLDRIGQASSAAASPFANTSVSPTVTYQRLLGAGRILDAAAAQMEMARHDFGEPRIRLIEQTGLIRIEMTGNSAEDARARARALLAAFTAEVDALRRDEIGQRETGGAEAIDAYRVAVDRVRARISALQRDTGLMSAAQYEAMVEAAEALARELGALETRLSERAEAVAALQEALDLTPRLAAATLRLHADSEFAAIVAEMAEQAALEARLAGQFGPNHPRVTDARAALSATLVRSRDRARTITGLEAGAAARLDLSPIGGRGPLLARLVEAETERAALAAEHRALAARVAEAEARVAGLIDAAAELEGLQRDHAVAEAVFASALARADTSRTDLFVSYPLVQVLEDPSLPDYPSSPRRKLAVAAGGAASLCLLIGLGMGWLRRPLIDRLLARPA